MPPGRIALYKPNELTEFAERVSAYFQKCDIEKDIPRVTGLCLHLGMTRETLRQYEKKDGFSDIIKMAKLVVEDYCVKQVLTAEKPTGYIFVLKTSFGYIEPKDVGMSEGGKESEQIGDISEENARKVKDLFDKITV